jgi:hypothetical protein
MRRRFLATGFICLCGLTVPATLAAQPRAAARATAAERGAQQLVVTNQDLAVVLETRRATLPAGEVELVWESAPPSTRTETWSLVNAREAGLRALGLSAPLTGQTGEGQGWLASLVGRSVRVQRPGGAAVDAEVLAVHGPTPDMVLFREGGEVVYGEPDARISVAAPATAPRALAGVTLRLASDRAGARDLTSRYLVSGLTWHADYALTLAPDEKSGRLEGWFTVDNRSGADFRPSRLRLLAGVLRTAPEAPPGAMMRQSGMMAMEASVAQSAELSESRIYDVPPPAAISAGRTTIPLAENAAVALEKRYLVRTTFWMGQNDETQRVPVVVGYRLATRALEKALPAGIVRVYADGGTVFTGEDRIEHTAEKTDVEIETSEAFDLAARRRQVSFQQTDRFVSESAWEVTITSRKKEAVVVTVRESFPGEWTIVESSIPPKRRSASIAEFDVPVPAGGEAKLTYRVRVRTGR